VTLLDVTCHFVRRHLSPHDVVTHTASYSPLHIGWHRILRIFLKTFNLVPGVPGFSIITCKPNGQNSGMLKSD